MKADRCDAHKQEGSLHYTTIIAVNTLWGSDIIIKAGMRHLRCSLLPMHSYPSSQESPRWKLRDVGLDTPGFLKISYK